MSRCTAVSRSRTSPRWWRWREVGEGAPRDGVAVFGQQAGERGVGAEGAAQVGFDEAVDEQGDADDGDERVDAVVVVQEDRPYVQGLFEVRCGHRGQLVPRGFGG